MERYVSISGVLANEYSYAELKEVLWDGLGFVDFAFVPHWKSNHPESAAIDKLIDYCKHPLQGYKRR